MNSYLPVALIAIFVIGVVILTMWQEIKRLRKSRNELLKLKNEIRIKQTIDRVTKL